MLRRILFLQGTSSLGGSKRSLLGLIEALRDTDYAPVVACPERGWLTEQLDQAQTPYVLVPFYAWRKWLERPRVSPSIRRKWLPALSRWHFDLIHCNEFWWAPHAVLLAKALGVPSIVHLRDGHHTLKKAHQYRLPEANQVLAVSTELREQFAADSELYGKTQVLFNGHDETLIRFAGNRDNVRTAMEVRPGAVAIGNAGKLCERKNQRLLLKAAAQLRRELPLLLFQIFFAGEADPPYAAQMRQDTQQLGLENEVKVLGEVQDMSGFFAAMDLVVHCARREGLPRVIPEAMLARRPVVATAAQGVRDAIPEDRFGAVVPPDDPIALAQAIARLAIDLPLRARLAEAAFQRAQALFSLPAQRERLLRIYGDLVTAGGTAPSAASSSAGNEDGQQALSATGDADRTEHRL